MDAHSWGIIPAPEGSSKSLTFLSFWCGTETPKLTDGGSRLITEMQLGKEPVSCQACVQGSRWSLPKAKKRTGAHEACQATGQFLHETVTPGSHCWRHERGRGMKTSNSSMAIHQAIHATALDVCRQMMCTVNWESWKAPGHYWAGGEGWWRLLNWALQEWGLLEKYEK